MSAAAVSEDFPLWLEIEGIVDWVRGYAQRKSIPFPLPSEIQELYPKPEEESDEVEGNGEGEVEQQENGEGGEKGEGGEEEGGVPSDREQFEMYVGMYQTAIEMIAEARSGGEAEEE